MLISDGPKDSANKYCGQLSPCFSLFWGKKRTLSPKDERDHPNFHQRQLQKQTSVMVWVGISGNSMGDLHEGTIDAEVCIGILETCIAIKMTSFLGRKTMPGLILHMLHQSGFYTLYTVEGMRLTACLKSRSVFYWKCM